MSGLSGVTVSSDCITKYQELKLGKQLKYILFKLNDSKTEIVVEKTSDSDQYDDFLEELPMDDCRWVVYDLKFEKDGTARNKLCFIAWSPDDAKIKQKMVYASSKEALRRTLDGVSVEIQGTDSSEVSHECVLNKAMAGTR